MVSDYQVLWILVFVCYKNEINEEQITVQSKTVMQLW